MNKKLHDATAHEVVKIFFGFRIRLQSVTVSLGSNSTHHAKKSAIASSSYGKTSATVAGHLPRVSSETFASSFASRMPLDGFGVGDDEKEAAERALESLHDKLSNFLGRLSEAQRNILLNTYGTVSSR